MPERRRPLLIVACGLIVAALSGAPATANHSWAGYHWARAVNPVAVKLGDNVSPQWDDVLRTTAADWTASTVLDTKVGIGRAGGLPGKCKPTLGRVEVCNGQYGETGWLGFANVWVTGLHITQGRVKLNDTYFNTAAYDTPEWRNFISCQEVGHTFGLAHQDEDFTNANLGTCMDYTAEPATNQHPNQHDYDELELIYRHSDLTTAGPVAAAASTAASANPVTDPGEGDDLAGWGEPLDTSADGRSDLFVKPVGPDQHLFTFVVWAQ